MARLDQCIIEGELARRAGVKPREILPGPRTLVPLERRRRRHPALRTPAQSDHAVRRARFGKGELHGRGRAPGLERPDRGRRARPRIPDPAVEDEDVPARVVDAGGVAILHRTASQRGER